jgi:hypothetical protein
MWRLRGRIPGSEVDALMREDRHRSARYANEIGKPGEDSVQRYRPLGGQYTICEKRYVNAKYNPAGISIKTPVPMFGKY